MERTRWLPRGLIWRRWCQKIQRLTYGLTLKKFSRIFSELGRAKIISLWWKGRKCQKITPNGWVATDRADEARRRTVETVKIRKVEKGIKLKEGNLTEKKEGGLGAVRTKKTKTKVGSTTDRSRKDSKLRWSNRWFHGDWAKENKQAANLDSSWTTSTWATKKASNQTDIGAWTCYQADSWVTICDK